MNERDSILHLLPFCFYDLHSAFAITSLNLFLWSDFLLHWKRFISLSPMLFELRALLIEHIKLPEDIYHGLLVKSKVHCASNAAVYQLNELLYVE